MANLAEALRDFESQNAIGGKKLIQILKENDLHVLNEEDLFLGIMDWINADLPARQQFTVGILQLVYLHCVPARILKNNLYVEAFMKDEACRDLYIDALHCHAIKEIRETRPLRPRYQRCTTNNKVLVTFKGTRPLYYETEDNKWHDVPGMDRTPSGQYVKCVGTVNYIFLLVDSCKLWRYSCVSNSWAEIFLPEKYSIFDDVLFHNGMLYAMHNKEMWKIEVNEIDFDELWETCEECTHICTTSYAFGKCIIRFGRSHSKKTYYCSSYDVKLDEYFRIEYKLEKAVIAQKQNHVSVMISNGCLFNWYKWVKHCIGKDTP
ncbi:uncharacterized protein [Antedon mediterranea]|uniref:uncharacterized protein n=1 Tax=Antedon mediterranea TaxID=105859 RepID=UPI003AF805C3